MRSGCRFTTSFRGSDSFIERLADALHERLNRLEFAGNHALLEDRIDGTRLVLGAELHLHCCVGSGIDFGEMLFDLGAERWRHMRGDPGTESVEASGGPIIALWFLWCDEIHVPAHDDVPPAGGISYAELAARELRALEFRYMEWNVDGVHHIHAYGHGLRFIVAAPTRGIARIEVLAQVRELIREGVVTVRVAS